MVDRKAFRLGRGRRKTSSYWREVWWPALKFCLILTAIVTVLGFVLIDIMNG